MKAALYTRVSTEMQAEDGFSLAGQLNLLQEYCTRNNIEVYEVYSDEGISGQKENRPAFQKMIRDAEKKYFDIILVYKFDRFARKVELSQRVKNQLRKSGINVVSITEPVEDSPIGFFTSGIMDLLAEYFVKDLSVKTKMGQVERASQGYHNGSVPFGYKGNKETGEMEIIPEHAEIIKDIFDMYVNKGYGSTKIARILNWGETISPVKNIWSHYTVSRILKNVKYIGLIEYDGKIYQGKHEPIIDKETFELVQRYMKDRTWQREYRGFNYDKFLLLGLLKCGYCKRTFRLLPGKFSKKQPEKRRYYYKCNSRSDKGDCDFKKSFPVKELESNVLDGIKQFMQGNNSNFAIHAKTNTLSTLHDRKKKLSNELERAKAAYLSAVFTLDEYSKIRKNVEKELLEIELSSKDNYQDFVPEMKEKVKTLWDEFEAADTIASKKTILKQFIDGIYVYKDHIHIEYYL